MAIKQKDIAVKLGISVSLVSRVLSGRAQEIGIAAETIESVLRAAAEAGYVPNAAALSLKGKPTRTIGVVVYDFDDPFFGTIVRQLQICAHAADYSLALAGFLNRSPDEQDLRPLFKNRLDGLIIAGSGPRPPWLDRFAKLPIARIGEGDPAEQSLQFGTDSRRAAELLATRLAETGRDSALFLSEDLPHCRNRFRHFEQAIARYGIQTAARWQATGTRSAFENGRRLTENLPEQKLPAALVCANDRIAIAVIRTLHDRGIQVPARVAVIGYDDIPAAEQIIPALTTLRQPVGVIARAAFDALLRHDPPGQTFFEPKLMVRESG